MKSNINDLALPTGSRTGTILICVSDTSVRKVLNGFSRAACICPGGTCSSKTHYKPFPSHYIDAETF